VAAFEDLSGRSAGPRTLRLRGLAVLAALIAFAMLCYQMAIGTFEPAFRLTVVADSIGEGLTPGAEVKYRGLTIGSVKSLEAVGYGKQQMALVLDPTKAAALHADTTARFTSSNVFGSAAVELVSNGQGAALSPGGTLLIGKDMQSASITGLLRQGTELASVLDSPELDRVIAVLRKNANIVEPVTRSAIDTAKILADAQRVPISQSLSVIASFVNGVNDLLPLATLLNQLLDQLDFLVKGDGGERTNAVLVQVGGLLNVVGKLIADNQHWLVPGVHGLVNIGAPTAYALGSLAPSYDRISGLIDRTSTAFPVIDGKVRMRVDVSLDAMPGLAAALPTGVPQGVPTADAPLPAEAPIGGGR
jgi:ABC-type transporter Mla subunit MlaD